MMTTRRLDYQLLSRAILAAAIFVFLSIRDGSFATPANVYTLFEGFAFSGLAALAIGISMIAGELDLSVGSMAGLAGIIAVMLSNSIGPIPAVLIAVVVAMILGGLQGLAIGLLKINSLVFTVGSMMALRGLAYIVCNQNTVVLRDLDIADVVKHQLFLFSPFSLITIALFTALWIFMTYSSVGRDIYAIGGGRLEAVAAGIPLTRTLVIVFGLSGSLAGLAGALVSLKSGSATPFGLADLTLPAATAALVGGVRIEGGKGSAIGIAVGVFILRFIGSYINLQGAPYFVESLATGAILLVVIAIELVTETPRLRERWARRRRAWAAEPRPPS
ncbi:MAG: ABC transporter permease [Chloroflexi bacterium]|nr:ABC transporter permease [Chloroflexota bacterium]